jgi:Superfamily II DNA and RNA helicases
MKNLYGTEILIATPGRLLDLMDHNAFTMDQLQYLVIDEADKMFQLGFGDEMARILKAVPAKKQSILFSATLNDKVDEIKSTLKINPEVVEVKKRRIERRNREYRTNCLQSRC